MDYLQRLSMWVSMGIKSFRSDPADSDYQRGYQQALLDVAVEIDILLELRRKAQERENF